MSGLLRVFRLLRLAWSCLDVLLPLASSMFFELLVAVYSLRLASTWLGMFSPVALSQYFRIARPGPLAHTCAIATSANTLYSEVFRHGVLH
jgi:hypothetical protein